MATSQDVQKVEVVPSETAEEELDAWYEDDEDNKDLSAGEQAAVGEGSSPKPKAATTPPDTEDPIPDEAKAPLDDGTPSPQVAQEPNPYAWVEELDPELRKQAEALVHRDQSQMGRVAALQSRLDKQQAQMDAAQVVNRDRRQKAVEAVEEDQADEGLKDFMEEFPAVADNVNKMVELATAKNRQDILAELAPLKEANARAVIEAQRTNLRVNAAKIFNTAETGISLEDVTESEAWKDWLTSQPTGYQQYARTATGADDASKVLQDFADYAEQVMYDQWSRDNPEAVEEHNTGEADRLAARRASALSASTPHSSSATIDDGNSGDYEAYFDQAAAADG